MGEIPIVSKKDVKGNVVLIRVDHNVVKNGMVEDPYILSFISFNQSSC